MAKFIVTVSKPTGEMVESKSFRVLGIAQDYYREKSNAGFFCMIHMRED